MGQLVRALDTFPQLNDGYTEVDGTSARVKRTVNLGVAVDLKKDGAHAPRAQHQERKQSQLFEFLTAYDDVIQRAREGKLQISDFQGTSVS